MSDEDITESEINEAIDRIQMLEGAAGMAFEHDLQIRHAGERGIGLVWASDGECWAVPPDPFYTKDFLFRLKSMCNRLRRLSLAPTTPIAKTGE